MESLFLSSSATRLAIAVAFLLALFTGSTTTLLIGAVLASFVYYACVQHWSFFTAQRVPFDRGLPVLGSMWRMMCGRQSLNGTFDELYKKFPNERFFGMFEVLGRPVYMIRDPELAKQIFIKDFDHFVNHRTTVSPDNDAIMGRTMFVVKDDRWRTIRSTISPAFTSSKMRLMLSLVSDCARNFAAQLRVETRDEPQVYDIRDLFGRFACDTIATSAFGLEVNSLIERDNEFYRMGMNVSNFSGLQGLKFLAYSSIPKVMKFFRISFFSKSQIAYFRDLVHGNMRYREENNVVRHDMINLLIEAKKGKLFHSETDAAASATERNIGFATVEESDVGKSDKVIQKWEGDDLVAQSMLFILAGFNAVTMSVSFMAHELAVNPDIQQRLYDEIQSVADEFAGKPISYETLQSMKYLDMVVCETLRRWPLAGSQDRYVNKPYEMVQRDGSKVRLEVGDGVWVPIVGFHFDPLYFPDPMRFDPERFSDENKNNIVSGTYLPFGAGPRNCVGSRFALMEMKALFVYLLREFSLHKCDRTMDPLEMKTGASVVMEPRDGFWLELRSRSRKL